MIPMLKIAVIGGRETVMGFKALGLEACAAANAEEARAQLHQMGRPEQDYAIIYVEENLAADPDMAKEISRYKDMTKPAVILIPGRKGPLGLGQRALQEAVERAIGSDIS